MGLNYLLFRHQVSLASAATAKSPEARYCHNKLAAEYARRIDEQFSAQRSSSRPLVPLA